MTTLTGFFKDSVSTLGIFYPKHYIIAAFPTFAKTKEAAQVLRRIGFAEDEMAAVPADQMLTFFEEFRANSGLWAGVMTVVSRAFGTEQVFSDSHVESALGGAAFLAVYSKDDAAAHCIKDQLAPLEPLTMYWYTSGGVEAMI